MAYRDTWLWVPKGKVNTRMLRHSLTLDINGGRDSIKMFREAEHHLGIPRERLDEDELNFEVVDLTPKTFDPISVKSKIVLDAQDPTSRQQEDAYADLMTADNGILNVKCGLGKTVLALHAVAEWGVPALVIAAAGHLKQWESEIKLHLEMDGEIGWIQGKPEKWRWKGCPIILASLKTLSIYADEVPFDLCRYPGVVIWDEIHHLAAKWYSRTSDMFPCRRLGLTATVNRPDGLEMQYLWHVGPVIHRNLEYDLVPEVTFIESPTTVDWNDKEARKEFCDKFNEVHIQKLCAYVGQRPEEIAFAKSIVDREVAAGGNILALSVSRDHSRALHELYPDSGVIDANVPFKRRLDMLHEHELVFATVQIAREALNKKELDVLVLLTEFSSDNNLQQAIGRVLRKCAGKMPKVIVLSHVNVGPMVNMGHNLRRHFRRWGMEVRSE